MTEKKFAEQLDDIVRKVLLEAGAHPKQHLYHAKFDILDARAFGILHTTLIVLLTGDGS
jgi:hypothetical protein